MEFRIKISRNAYESSYDENLIKQLCKENYLKAQNFIFI